jgi:hypothetical protein
MESTNKPITTLYLTWLLVVDQMQIPLEWIREFEGVKMGPTTKERFHE